MAPRDDAGRRTTNPLPRTCRARRERRFSAQCPCGGRWSSAGPVRSSAPPTAGTATPEEIRVLWCMRNAAPVGWRVSRGPGTGFSGVQLPSADIGAKVRHHLELGLRSSSPMLLSPLPASSSSVEPVLRCSAGSAVRTPRVNHNSIFHLSTIRTAPLPSAVSRSGTAPATHIHAPAYRRRPSGTYDYMYIASLL